MTLNNKRANDETRRRQRERNAKLAADNDQKPARKLVGTINGGNRNPKPIWISLARITMGSD